MSVAAQALAEAAIFLLFIIGGPIAIAAIWCCLISALFRRHTNRHTKRKRN